MKKTVFILAMLGFQYGCFDPHAQESAIVREVEAAGSGNISTYTYQGLAEWFSHRPELAKRISAQCLPLSEHAAANWLMTAEGATCHAASVMERPTEWTADTRVW